MLSNSQEQYAFDRGIVSEVILQANQSMGHMPTKYIGMHSQPRLHGTLGYLGGQSTVDLLLCCLDCLICAQKIVSVKSNLGYLYTTPCKNKSKATNSILVLVVV